MPKAPLIACPSCGCHFAGEAICPHCETPFLRPTATAAAMLLGLALAGCDGGGGLFPGDDDTVALYGVPDTGAWEDADSDGWARAEGDCEDDDPAIHPEAEETPGDGVDSNCDGDDDT